MGGIFGIPASNGSISKTALERATDSLADRGPDDKGTVVIQAGTSSHLEVGLGSRRLAVLDLSPSGHQPMQDAETGNSGLAARCARRHPACAQGHGSAHHRWSQYIS